MPAGEVNQRQEQGGLNLLGSLQMLENKVCERRMVPTLWNHLFENPLSHMKCASCSGTSGLLQAVTHRPFRFYFRSAATWKEFLDGFWCSTSRTSAQSCSSLLTVDTTLWLSHLWTKAKGVVFLPQQ